MNDQNNNYRITQPTQARDKQFVLSEPDGGFYKDVLIADLIGNRQMLFNKSELEFILAIGPQLLNKMEYS